MCSLSKEQSILSRETIQNAFLTELRPFFELEFLSSIKHPAAERWYAHAVLLLIDIMTLEDIAFSKPFLQTFDVYKLITFSFY